MNASAPVLAGSATRVVGHHALDAARVRRVARRHRLGGLGTRSREALAHGTLPPCPIATPVGGLPISPRLLLMLEAAANCAPLRRLPSIASAGRGQGIQLVSVWQDEGQIETIFPASRARTVWANRTAKITLSGVSDHRTLESMSNLVGDDSLRRTTESRGADRAQSESTSWHSERLAPPQYVRELEEGMALAMVGNRKPMRLETRAWFEDELLRARVAPKIAASYDAAFAPAAIGGRQSRGSRPGARR